MPRLCASCKEETDKPKYCSTSCAQKGRGISIVDAWLRGEIDALGKAGKMLAPIRDYLIDEAGDKCTKCGWNKPNPVTKRPHLVVSHKDGNHKNNFKTNLEVLCGNCQTLTPTFGALNRGKTLSPNSVFSRKKWDK